MAWLCVCNWDGLWSVSECLLPCPLLLPGQQWSKQTITLNSDSCAPTVCVVSYQCRVLCTHYCSLLVQLAKAGLKFRAATITLLYRKSLRVNLATLSKFSMGEVANFMSTDTDRIANYTNSFHEFWSLPLQIVVALVLLYLQVGALHAELILSATFSMPVGRFMYSGTSL